MICGADVQRERLIERGMAPTDADQRIAAQAGIDDRAGAAATRTIDTSADRATTRAMVEAALSEALRRD